MGGLLLPELLNVTAAWMRAGMLMSEPSRGADVQRGSAGATRLRRSPGAGGYWRLTQEVRASTRKLRHVRGQARARTRMFQP
jgi:hypothetical protein